MEVLKIIDNPDGSANLTLEMSEDEYDILLFEGLRLFIKNENLNLNLSYVIDEDIKECKKTYSLSEEECQMLINDAVNNLLREYITKKENEKNEV